MTRMHKLFYAVAAMLCISITALAAGDKAVSAAKLLEEMIDRDALAIYPSPDYNLKQASSYDRATVSKDAPGWFANFDLVNFVYEEDHDGRHEFVMMDEKGPGAIVRFWMTFAGNNVGKGTLRIYIDDMDTPAICGSGFDVLSGGLLAGAPLSDSVSPLTEHKFRGHDLYYPIVYSKRCKVTYESEWVRAGGDDFEWVFYNIDFREYAKGTQVVPFSWENVKKDAPLAEKVNSILKEGVDNFSTKGTKSESFETVVRPGESVSMTIKGPRAITRLEAMLDAADKEQALRSTVVEMIFDGNSTVWCPFGDLIGTGYHDIYTSTWMTRVKDGLCTSLWVMPFKKQCELIIHNLGDQTVSLKNGKVVTKSWKWNDRSMYFGANWTHYNHWIAGDGNGKHPSPQDLNFTHLRGKGVYVGDAISLYDTISDWWGEGDEKIYVDGETFPSSIGTGTEDYYGYAWCRPEVFTDHPFIAQPSGDGNITVGYTSNSRYRALDRIPFRTSLDFDMELWHWGEAIVSYAPTSLWYILPGGMCERPRDFDGARDKVIRDRSELYPPVVQMSIEGEDVKVEEITGGTVTSQKNPDYWSKEYQFWWKDASAGDVLTISFISPAEGEFNIIGILTKAVDYSTVKMELNGTTIAEKLDLSARELGTGRYDFGIQKLQKGKNVMTVHALSPAPGSEKCMWGLDRLEFLIP